MNFDGWNHKLVGGREKKRDDRLLLYSVYLKKDLINLLLVPIPTTFDTVHL